MAILHSEGGFSAANEAPGLHANVQRLSTQILSTRICEVWQDNGAWPFRVPEEGDVACPISALLY
eukprot:3744795-Rhodomonas_salina.1